MDTSHKQSPKKQTKGEYFATEIVDEDDDSTEACAFPDLIKDPNDSFEIEREILEAYHGRNANIDDMIVQKSTESLEAVKQK